MLLDVLTEDPQWYARSSARLSAVVEDNVLVTNPIVYAEVSIGFDRIEEVEAARYRSYFPRLELLLP